jgi:hypothetical protein
MDRVRGYWRAWYYRNREAVCVSRRKRKADLRAWLAQYKAGLMCAGCGETHPATLDFHHTDATTKERTLGDAVRAMWSRRKVLAEIAKCEVLCANCHRKRHWQARLSEDAT